MSQQAKDIIEDFPTKRQAKTYYILGNHDLWYKGNAGARLDEVIESKRKDLVCLGDEQADIEFGNGSILRLLHPAGGSSYALCFDDKTEIRTDSGWKLFKDLKFNDEVLTLNLKTDETEFQRPISWTDEEYAGEMIHFNGKQFDIMVTPNHRMWVKRPWYGKWQFVEANNITKGRQWRINRTFKKWDGLDFNWWNIPLPKVKPKGKISNFVRKVKTEDWFRFMGWFLSEGNVGHKNKCVEINQCIKSNPDKYKEIVDLIKRMGFSVYCTDNKIKITSTQLYQLLKNSGNSHQKKIPFIMKEFDKKYLLAMLNSLFKGDGCFLKGKFQNYTTNSKQLADDIQEIIMKCGMACCIGRYGDRKSNFNQTRPIYQLSVSHRDIMPTIWNAPKKIQYNGRIYCVTVPNGIILVRRNGKVCWSGNSYKPQKIIEGLSNDKPNILAIGHYHKAAQFFYRNVFAFLTGCFEHQTPFMKGKGLAAHVGGWIVEGKSGKNGGIKMLRATYVPFMKG